MDSRAAITDLTLPELEERLHSLGAEKYRAKQVLRWIYRGRAATFGEMTNLPKDLRALLGEHFRVHRSKQADLHKSQDQTDKVLLELEDGDVIETVLIRETVTTKTGEPRERKTVCVSTQVGCPMACVFCASGLNGLKRNLSPGEIVDQVLHIQRMLPKDDRINNVVIMGIGEPLLNYDSLLRALRTWKASWGAGIGFNRVTLSTVGVLGRLRDLVRDKVTPNLAVSLHAPNDKVRSEIVPTMNNVRVEEIIRAGMEYKRNTRKNVTFEYVLLAGINDSPEQARELGHKVKNTRCKVNIIPYNRVEELPYKEPDATAIDRFVDALGTCGVPVTVRRRKGDEVAAACGQLRAKWKAHAR